MLLSGADWQHGGRSNTQRPNGSVADWRFCNTSWNGAKDIRRGPSVPETTHQKGRPHRRVRRSISRSTVAECAQQTRRPVASDVLAYSDRSISILDCFVLFKRVNMELCVTDRVKDVLTVKK